jgi:hypothetical protein
MPSLTVRKGAATEIDNPGSKNFCNLAQPSPSSEGGKFSGAGEHRTGNNRDVMRAFIPARTLLRESCGRASENLLNERGCRYLGSGLSELGSDSVRGFVAKFGLLLTSPCSDDETSRTLRSSSNGLAHGCVEPQTSTCRKSESTGVHCQEGSRCRSNKTT